jgi:hypothetical protein
VRAFVKVQGVPWAVKSISFNGTDDKARASMKMSDHGHIRQRWLGLGFATQKAFVLLVKKRPKEWDLLYDSLQLFSHHRVDYFYFL